MTDVLFSSGQVILVKNEALEDWFPSTPLTTVGVVNSVSECGMQCKMASCMSIVYETVNKICHLNYRLSQSISDCSWKPNTIQYEVVSEIINGYECSAFTDTCWKLLSLATWTKGKIECASEGASLPSIDSSIEQSAIQQYMAVRGLDRIWLGINDLDLEGDWRTEYGESLSAYSNFASGQPDNYLSQNCGSITTSFNYMWDDASCSLLFNVVCEIRKIELV
ncbi:C-type mannose receptor 2-like [Ylistrum balloti]|uniref:C-type mannose receptor 2-like n=1 Tax=Ylistrum balloti TaxID=509963 RepID=UPI002905AD44|nr:C-type mannose receptor 2-like [Ylistrum balloti]